MAVHPDHRAPWTLRTTRPGLHGCCIDKDFMAFGAEIKKTVCHFNEGTLSTAFRKLCVCDNANYSFERNDRGLHHTTHPEVTYTG